MTRTLLVAAAVLALVAGCADHDRSGRAALIGDPVSASPEATWQYMARALSEQRAAGWTNSLASSFGYVPDAVSDARYPGVLSAWDGAAEAAFVQALAAGNLEIAADLNVLDLPCPAGEGSTFAWSEVEYMVVVRGAGGANPMTYRGVAALEFELQGSLWYLSRWTDLRGAPAPWHEDVVCPTLGELRAVYRGE
jgi:hypothetical protein